VCCIFVYLQFWCVNPLEQVRVLAGTPSHFYHSRVKIGVRGSREAWSGVVVACVLCPVGIAGLFR
jgi:hypothetical protein